MAKSQVEKFIKSLKGASFRPHPYSGRDMMGQECVAVDDVSAWEIARFLWFKNPENEDLNIPEPREDKIAFGNVLYWPSYEWPKESA